MVYHGDVFASMDYFSKLGYVLPAGENIADWMIDISSGELKPESNDKTIRRSSVFMRSSANSHDVERLKSNRFDRISSIGNIAIAPQLSAVDEAKAARKALNEQWAKHMAALDKIDKKDYSPPPPYNLPEPIQKQPFQIQLLNHIIRNKIVMVRNKNSKVIDALILLIAVIAISLLNGTLEITREGSTADFNTLLVDDNHIALMGQWAKLTEYATLAYSKILQ